MSRYKVSVEGPEGTIEFDYPSVTEIIESVLAKPGLHDWYYRQGIMGVSLLMERYGDSLPHDVPSLHSLMKQEGFSPYAQRDAAGDQGKKIHGVVKQLAQGKRPKDFPVLTDWWKERGWRAANILATEQTVISFKGGYAGTVDLVYTEEGDVCLSDVKSGKVRESHALQLEGYRRAWEEQGLEKIHRMSIIQVPRDGSSISETEVPITTDLTEAWDGILDLWRWSRRRK